MKLKINLEEKDIKVFLKEIKLKYQINSIETTFNGCGDSGEIEIITATTHLSNPILFEEKEEKILREIFNNYLSSTDYNWYDNDGGFGTVTLNIETGTIECEMNINEVSYETYDLIDEGDFLKNYSKNYKKINI